jgi:hypothetical protein
VFQIVDGQSLNLREIHIQPTQYDCLGIPSTFPSKLHSSVVSVLILTPLSSRDTQIATMPLKVKPAPSGQKPLPPFTFSPPSSPPNAVASSSNPYPRPPADFLPERDMHMLGTYPLKGAGEPGRGHVRCLRCGRPTMEWAAGEHQSESAVV